MLSLLIERIAGKIIIRPAIRPEKSMHFERFLVYLKVSDIMGHDQSQDWSKNWKNEVERLEHILKEILEG